MYIIEVWLESEGYQGELSYNLAYIHYEYFTSYNEAQAYVRSMPDTNGIGQKKQYDIVKLERGIVNVYY